DGEAVQAVEGRGRNEFGDLVGHGLGRLFSTSNENKGEACGGEWFQHVGVPGCAALCGRALRSFARGGAECNVNQGGSCPIAVWALPVLARVLRLERRRVLR